MAARNTAHIGFVGCEELGEHSFTCIFVVECADCDAAIGSHHGDAMFVCGGCDWVEKTERDYGELIGTLKRRIGESA